jgi:hypothetical protein
MHPPEGILLDLLYGSLADQQGATQGGFGFFSFSFASRVNMGYLVAPNNIANSDRRRLIRVHLDLGRSFALLSNVASPDLNSDPSKYR